MASHTCSYLEVETTAHRPPGHELSDFRRFDTRKTWYCGHPFHGIRVELGDSLPRVQERCRKCALVVDGGADGIAEGTGETTGNVA